MTQLKIAVAGASGRMGRMLIEAIAQAPDTVLAGALDVAGSPSIGQDAGAFAGQPTGVLIESRPALDAELAALVVAQQRELIDSAVGTGDQIFQPHDDVARPGDEPGSTDQHQ